MEELDIKTAIQIAKILAAAPDERIPMMCSARHRLTSTDLMSWQNGEHWTSRPH